MDLYEAQYKKHDLGEGLVWQKIKWILRWNSLFFVKYFFNWGSSFWLFLSWGTSLEFLSVITASAKWEAVLDLEIPSWILVHTKLS